MSREGEKKEINRSIILLQIIGPILVILAMFILILGQNLSPILTIGALIIMCLSVVNLTIAISRYFSFRSKLL